MSRYWISVSEAISSKKNQVRNLYIGLWVELMSDMLIDQLQKAIHFLYQYQRFLQTCSELIVRASEIYTALFKAGVTSIATATATAT